MKKDELLTTIRNNIGKNSKKKRQTYKTLKVNYKNGTNK